jgi:hypothetical protein
VRERLETELAVICADTRGADAAKRKIFDGEMK